MRQHAFFDPDEEHVRELQPFGGVQRDQRDRIGGMAALVELIHVLDQRDVFEECGQRVLGRQLVVALGLAAKLLDVRQALLALVGTVLKRLRVPAALQDRIDYVEHVHLGHAGADGLDNVGERAEQLASAHGERRLRREWIARAVESERRHARDGLIGRDTLGGGPAHQLLDRLLTNAPRGQIDDPLKTDCIERIVNQAQIRQDVLDLFALVKPNAADQTVRQPRLDKRIFDST